MPAPDPRLDEAEERLRTAIPEAIGKLTVKWVLIAEVIDSEDGEKAIASFASEGCKTWESRGLLGWGLAEEDAVQIQDWIGGDR